MDMRITFPGGRRVDADFGAHVIHTDQSREHGGDGSAPEPFDTFLASLGTCAGLYVLGFCQARSIPTDAISLVQRACFNDDDGHLERVELDVLVSEDFPAKYRDAVARAAAHCKVKQALSASPVFIVTTKVAALSEPSKGTDRAHPNGASSGA